MEMITNVDLKVVGVTFKNDDGTSRKEKIMEMANLDNRCAVNIELVREPNNQFDVNAIKVIADGVQIGYIGKDFAALLSPMMDNEFRRFSASVKNCGEYKSRPYCEITINEIA